MKSVVVPSKNHQNLSLQVVFLSEFCKKMNSRILFCALMIFRENSLLIRSMGVFQKYHISLADTDPQKTVISDFDYTRIFEDFRRFSLDLQRLYAFL